MTRISDRAKKSVTFTVTSPRYLWIWAPCQPSPLDIAWGNVTATHQVVISYESYLSPRNASCKHSHAMKKVAFTVDAFTMPITRILRFPTNTNAPVSPTYHQSQSEETPDIVTHCSWVCSRNVFVRGTAQDRLRNYLPVSRSQLVSIYNLVAAVSGPGDSFLRRLVMYVYCLS